MEEKFSCYVFLRTTEVIEVTQEITNTGIIPMEALRAHLSKRPHSSQGPLGLGYGPLTAPGMAVTGP